METRNIVFGSTENNNEVDLIDVAALVLLPNMAALLFEVFTWEIQVFGGYDFVAPIWTILGADISLAFILVIFSLGWIVMTNLANKKTKMGQYEFAAVVASLALPVLYVLIPSVADLVMYHDLAQLAAVMYVGAGAVYTSYVG